MAAGVLQDLLVDRAQVLGIQVDRAAAQRLPDDRGVAQARAQLDACVGRGGLAQQMALFSLAEWQEAIYTRIVDKVGTRTYWEQWAADVADIASALVTRISMRTPGSSTGTTVAVSADNRSLA